MAPCARCCYMGARCVTGAPGHPGRPPKHRLAVSSPGPHGKSTLRDVHAVESHAPIMAVAAAHEPQPDFWAVSGDMSAFFASPSPSPSMHHSPASGEDILQGLLGADDDLYAMLHVGGDASTALDLDMDPLLDHEERLLPLTPLPQCSSAASLLMKFREDVEQRITTVDAYYADSSQVLHGCKDGGAGRDVENPAALLLTCTKQFTDIIQGLIPATHLYTQTEDTLSTEIVLQVLSSYLALIRLFDSLFHRIYQYICQVPPESYQSIKVKSVLRIGGISSLQNMPLKAYAMGILDAIQGQMQTLERCMGIPADYCLSGEAAALPTEATPGIFSRAHRARLFWAVMAQEDVKSRRGSMSYVESIRASIKESMAFLHD
ncbi:hypothetical protein P153DRAFT_389059 [Dothidotthia symphoricarpi CBS 119687]|uniref:Uncharacterized protein n=1 Tax=Dothidotthia symphoricarpi CBS 119687 TaxID=1392245 RepID=A0A6A6A353_9PLEO|nr:uncharacterized protein P153DRAFT_389059 [Dothidotthia symphoricarpi CBS 119687]KAF2125605.1 hypothetical protein P153DRAFT_389059 [Dothidotthia symphoricarpi CBS 119687]